ncbi:MAG: methyltransferase domain-containing protein [Desulfobacterales bacterium]
MQKSDILNRNFNSTKTRKAYSRIAWFYDLWGWLTESKAERKVLDLASIRDGEYVLEAAVGTGRLFEQIARYNPNGLTAGFDLTDAMLNRALRRFSRSNKQLYSLAISDAYQLPYSAESFDLLINNFMLDLLPENDYLHILAEFSRVLKPGGRLLISTMACGPRWYHRFWAWLAGTFPSLLTNCRPVNILNYLTEAGLQVTDSAFITQNTFPSRVAVAVK